MKFDLHTHTYYSDDAASTPEDMVKAAKKKGLHGLAITDHNTTMGWKRALSAGKKEGIIVIKAEEVKVFHEGNMIGEVLALFINEEIAPGEFMDVCEKIKAQGGLMVVAHPFDKFRNAFTMLEKCKKHFDAVEAFNARVIFNGYNAKARKFASDNGFAMTGGSDGHCKFEVGNGYTQADARDAEGLMKEIRQKKTQALGKKTNPLIHTLSTVAKSGVVGKVREPC
jgi:predicted metal-dependent phosphoesterase TrpH